MPYSPLAHLRHLSLRAVTITIVGLSALSVAQGQVQYASCKFHIFLLDPSKPDDPAIGWGLGMNDWGTVVGQAVNLVQGPIYTKGFTRYSDGTVSYYSRSGDPFTFFYARSNSGVTVGGSIDTLGRTHAYTQQGSTVTTINDPRSTPYSTRALGINKYNSVVGSYLDPATGAARGFKRFSNGGFVGLNYPGAQATYPTSINDSGAVVGTYTNAYGVLHGFIYYNRKWATLDYALSPSPNLTGISNAGVVLGQNFIYANGTFKLLPNVPNFTWTEFAGISPGGMITGRALGFSANPYDYYGFTATCH